MMSIPLLEKLSRLFLVKLNCPDIFPQNYVHKIANTVAYELMYMDGSLKYNGVTRDYGRQRG